MWWTRTNIWIRNSTTKWLSTTISKKSFCTAYASFRIRHSDSRQTTYINGTGTIAEALDEFASVVAFACCQTGRAADTRDLYNTHRIVAMLRVHNYAMLYASTRASYETDDDDAVCAENGLQRVVLLSRWRPRKRATDSRSSRSTRRASRASLGGFAPSHRRSRLRSSSRLPSNRLRISSALHPTILFRRQHPLPVQ